MSTHEPRIALVTGANRGVGFEVCRQLLSRGYNVFVAARDETKANDAAHALAGSEGEAIPIALDVSADESIKHAAQLAAERCKHLDVLINNAAIMYDDWALAQSVDLQAVHKALETNLFGAWRTIQAFLPLLKRSRSAQSINVSSEGGLLREMSRGIPALL